MSRKNQRDYGDGSQEIRTIPSVGRLSLGGLQGALILTTPLQANQQIFQLLSNQWAIDELIIFTIQLLIE